MSSTPTLEQHSSKNTQQVESGSVVNAVLPSTILSFTKHSIIIKKLELDKLLKLVVDGQFFLNESIQQLLKSIQQTSYPQKFLTVRLTFCGSIIILRLPPPNFPSTLNATWATASFGFLSVLHRACISSARTGWMWSYRNSGWRLSTHSSSVRRPWNQRKITYHSQLNS